MGSVRKLDRQQRFDLDQQHPAFLAWLGRMNTSLAGFLTEDAPEVGELRDPWTREGLCRMVQAARREFGDFREMLKAENRPRADRYVRYLGEVYVRTFGARWINSPSSTTDDVTFYPMIEGPTPPIGYIDPEAQVIGAFVTQLDKHTPAPPDGQPVWVFDNMTRRFQRWQELGQPGPGEWQKIVVQDLLDGRT